jgi:hypothetical protein
MINIIVILVGIMILHFIHRLIGTFGDDDGEKIMVGVTEVMEQI